MYAPVLPPETSDERPAEPESGEPAKVALRGMADAALLIEAGWVLTVVVTTVVNLDRYDPELLALLALIVLLFGASAYAIVILRDIDRLRSATTCLILAHLSAIIAYDVAVAEPASVLNPALIIAAASCIIAGFAYPAGHAVAFAVLVTGLHVGFEVGAPGAGDVALAIPIVLTTMSSVLAACLIRRALLKSAAQVAQVLATTVQRQRQAVSAQARTQERAATARALHDTVLNTLDAVATGRLRDPGSAALRASFARDVTVLENQVSAGAEMDRRESLPVSLANLADEFDRHALAISVRGNAPAHLPSEVVAAIVGAARAALLNVVEHASSDRAQVRIGEPAPGSVSVSIRDEGRGFVVRIAPGHLGIPESIVRRLGDVGGSARVETTLGAGTTVTLEWHPPLQEQETEPRLPALWAETVPRGAALGLLCYSSLYALGLFMTQLTEFPVLWPQAVALSLVLIGDAVVAVELIRQRRLSSLVVAMVVVRTPVVMLFSGLSLAGCERMGFSMFVGGSTAALCGVLAITGHLRAALLALLARTAAYVGLGLDQFATGQACSITAANQSILAATLVLAGWWFVRALDRHARLAHAALSEVETVQRQRLIADSVAVERNRLYPVLRHALLDVVTGLADGRLDPRSSEVRAQCRGAAVLLRGYLTQSIDSDEVMTALFATSVQLREQGIEVAVRGRLEAGTLTAVQRQVADRTIRDMLTSLVGQGWSGSCTLTALSTSRNDVIGVHLAGLPPHAAHQEIDLAAVSALATVERELDGDQLLLTFRFARHDRNESLGSPPHVDQLA